MFFERPLPCVKAADINDDGSVHLADPIDSLTYLFRGGPAPLPPFPACGVDQTEDDLPCQGSPNCP
jgi:hypothetical protein